MTFPTVLCQTFADRIKKAITASAASALLLFTLAIPHLQAANIASLHGGKSLRLPSYVRPVSYRMRIEPDLGRRTFKGRETIAIRLERKAKTIILNAAELRIERANILKQGEEKGFLPTHRLGMNARSITLDDKAEQAHIAFPHELAEGVYNLTLDFTGTLNDKLRGFYFSSYLDGKVRRALATTQMEPTDARRMFPCFDEPAFKATYRVSAVIDPHLVAISNAPVQTESIDKATGKKVVTFAETPRMSTYLLALIVGPFESTNERIVDGVPIRVWCVKGKKRLATYAQDFAARLLPYYNAYFQIPYPNKKLDLIAIPDFEAGAMENLGAVTFRESALLADAKEASTETKQRIASIIAHEMAHMWFGDLVTMAWWDDLWLNEAFATWMATKAVDALVPQWHFWDQFGLARIHALSTDSLQSTRPVHFKVLNPDQANEMFDEITYEKGASILRMLERFVGEKGFQKGVTNYLKKHAFANATGEDLWRSIGQETGKPVPRIMQEWVHDPGYPLVNVERSDAGRILRLTQKRFLLDAAADKRSGTTWHVPISIKALSPEAKSLSEHLLSKRESLIDLPEAPNLVLANANADGYYRVRYGEAELNKMRTLIQLQFSPPERLAFLSDQWALVLSGELPLGLYLDLTASYKHETDPSVVELLTLQLATLRNFIAAQDKASFEKLVRDRLLPSKVRLGWHAKAGESDLEKMLRSCVLEALGTFGQDQATIKEARELFARYRKIPASVDNNLMGAVTAIVAYNGSASDYHAMERLWKEAKTPEIERRNLFALAGFQNGQLLRRTLSLSLTYAVRTQDSPHLVAAILSSLAGQDMAFKFIRDNWQAILKRYPIGMIPKLVSAASSMTYPRQEAQLKAFFKTHPVPAGERAVTRMLERVHINVTFRQRSAQALHKWLAAWAAPAGGSGAP